MIIKELRTGRPLLEISGTSLDDAQLNGVDLSQADLRNQSLCRARLTDVIVSRSNWYSAEMDDIIILRSMLCRIGMAFATARRCQIKASYFNGSALECVDLDESIMSNVSFDKVRSDTLAFRRCKLTDVTFRGAELRGASFESTTMHRCDLRGALLLGATFESARLTECMLDGVRARVVSSGERCSPESPLLKRTFETSIYTAPILGGPI